VNRGVGEWQVGERRPDVHRVDVVEHAVVDRCRAEAGRERRGTERTPADTDRQHRLGVGNRFDRLANRRGVGLCRQIQRRVAERPLVAAGYDPLVGRSDPVVELLEPRLRDTRVGNRRQRVSDVDLHTRYSRGGRLAPVVGPEPKRRNTHPV
jgi:hypothetical protein